VEGEAEDGSIETRAAVTHARISISWTGRLWLLLGLVFVVCPRCVSAASTARGPITAERVVQGGVEYDLVWVDLRRSAIELFWKDADGSAFYTFWRLRSVLRRADRDLVFATNAGIFAKDETPLGLHIEGGKTLRALNRGRGGGNFFLKPNGVFWIADGRAHIDETEAFAALTPAPKPTVAVQSGPLLVHRGTLHYKLDPSSNSRYVRNGVGVHSPGLVVFAISSKPVNLHAFATLFRTTLGCSDALYLDGSLSEMYAPVIGRTPPGYGYVGILAVTRTEGN
jgi:uncharacterized protein YigE (DUF2233 family)